ncbi:hypothetical protein LTR17_018051 [Elasticomyces elasticus]|nr:hypothetical protein LTR17_018051 [Elasticomyces elasticus]
MGPDSPLLTLPAEIRCLIYKLVLGGQTLNVGSPAHYDDGRITGVKHSAVCVCIAASTDTNIANQRRNELGPIDRTHPGWTQPAMNLSGLDGHKTCCSGCYHRHCLPSLGLIGVNKLVYHEARILPFNHNTFTFGSRAALDNFLPKLFDWQLSELTSMVFYQKYRPSASAARAIEANIIPSRCRTTIVVNLDSTDINHMLESERHRRTERPIKADHFAKHIRQFRFTERGSVTVQFIDTHEGEVGDRSADFQSPLSTELQSFAANYNRIIYETASD